MLILGQKSCFLGPTIFEIPQPSWYYCRYVLYVIYCTQALKLNRSRNKCAVSTLLKHNLLNGEKWPSLAPPRCNNYKGQQAKQGVEIIQSMSASISKKVGKLWENGNTVVFSDSPHSWWLKPHQSLSNGATVRRRAKKHSQRSLKNCRVYEQVVHFIDDVLVPLSEVANLTWGY